MSVYALADPGCRFNLRSWPSPCATSNVASGRRAPVWSGQKVAGGLTWSATLAGAISTGILTWAAGLQSVRRKRPATVALCVDESGAMSPTGDEHFDNRSMEMNEWARIGDVERTKKIFFQLEEYGIPTTNNWNRVLHNTVLKAYAKVGDYRGACSWVERMDKKGIDMNAKALGKLFSAAARSGDVDVAEALFPSVLAAQKRATGRGSRRILWTILLDAFAKRGRWQQALQGLKTMKRTSAGPARQHYGACINACAKSKRPEKAKRLFDEMLRAGMQPTVVEYTSMVDAQGQGGSYAKAAKMMKDMIAQDVEPNANTFGAVLSACSKEVKKDPARGDALKSEVLELLREMKRRALEPDAVQYGAAIATLANASYVQGAKDLLQMKFEEGVQFGPPEFTEIINVHKRAGQTQEAVAWFEHMESQSVKPDWQAYNSLIDTFAVAGRATEAMKHMEKMEAERMKMTIVTHNAIIKAHARSQDVASALAWLQVMQSRRITPDVVSYTTILSCSGTAATADTAMSVVQDMVAKRVDPNPVCKTWLQRKLGNDRYDQLATEFQLKVVDYDENFNRNEGYVKRRRERRLNFDARSSSRGSTVDAEK